jgi:hypothetical protein
MIDRIKKLQQAMVDGGENVFELVPLTLQNVIKERAWESRKDKSGRLFTSFEAFVTHHFWEGLETSIDELRLYCRKHDEVLKLINTEVQPVEEYGVNQHTGGDNVTSSSARGNNPTYALKRLKRDRPDLADKVIAGELSANAAAIKAGFRKKLTPYEQILKLLPKLSKSERRKLQQVLKE